MPTSFILIDTWGLSAGGPAKVGELACCVGVEAQRQGGADVQPVLGGAAGRDDELVLAPSGSDIRPWSSVARSTALYSPFRLPSKAGGASPGTASVGSGRSG